LEIKVAHSAQDWRRAKEALGREHGLGAGSEAGDRLCQMVMEEGKLAGVLVWCAAAWHLKDRDEAVGWDAVILVSAYLPYEETAAPARRAMGKARVFLSTDIRQRKAAKAEGLTVMP
jgi:hypothetical protein